MKNMVSMLSFVSLTFLPQSVPAGSFWFPLEAHYPYSDYNNIQAVPDLDQRNFYIKSRMNEKGSYWKGCLDDFTDNNCASTSKFSSSSLWGYKKDISGKWQFDGVPYNGNNTYLFYDNHRGYDFVVSADIGVHAVEDGTFCGYVPTYGQICIQHNVREGTFQTYYAHMSDIPSWLKKASIGTFIPKLTQIGIVSDVGTKGAHLHFATYKYDPYHPDYLTRKTPSNNGWIVVDPYGLKNGVGGADLEPYLWN